MADPNQIYLDYAATTPVDEQVIAAMRPYFDNTFGNPSSIHAFGQEAEGALDDARRVLAGFLNCQLDEVVFTSCGSESDNLALRGVALAQRRLNNNSNHILISPVEHHAISKTAQQLAEVHGFELEFLPVDSYGRVEPGEVSKRIRKDTAIVSVIYANNEIGSVNPIADIGKICTDAGILFHTDAVQAAGLLPVDVERLNVDLLSIGAHKFYGPKGVGALYVRKNTPLIPHLTGGGQEMGKRAGTQNIPYIVGMAKAVELVQKEQTERVFRLTPLRDWLIEQVLEKIPGSQLTGHPTQRLANHASFVIEGVESNDMLMKLDLAGFACSAGSACKTGNPEPSEVLLAVGFSPQEALSSLRVTLGKDTQRQHLEAFVKQLEAIIVRV